MRRAALGVTLAFALTNVVSGAEDGGTQSVFAHGAGNRALALGGAFTAIADDASAPVWNAAGLARLERRQLVVSQASLYGLEIDEQHLGLAWPDWRWGTVAFTARRLGVSGIDARDDRNVPLGTFSDQELDFGLSYARPLNDVWSVGGSLRFRRQQVSDFSANGFGADLGLHVRPLLAAGVEAPWAGRLTGGFAVRNAVAPSLRLDRDAVSEPTEVALGFAWRQPLGAERAATAAVDVEKASGVGAHVRAGLEVRPHSVLALRAGWNGDDVTAGLGVSWRLFAFDYAFENSEIDPVHRFGATIGFGVTTSESRRLAQDAEEERFRQRLAETFQRKQEERVDELLSNAERMLADGAIEEALEVVAAARALSPDHPRAGRIETQALFARAEREEQESRFAEAAILYGRVIAIQPDNVEAQNGLLRCRTESNLRAERTSRIRALFAEALDAFTDNKLLLARQKLRDILTLAPDDGEANAMLARTETAISSRAKTLVEQANRSIDRGLLDEASDRLAEADRLDPRVAGLTKAQKRLRDAELALQDAARKKREELAQATSAPEPAKAPTLSRKKRKEIEDLYRRGMEAMDANRSDDALRYWELVWLADPAYENVAEFLKREYLLRGLEAFSRGNLDDAISVWERAQAVDPNDEKTLGYLARAREQQARSREILGTEGRK
ncbi:MAG: PorV/PorQ family protein [Gemmatimonadetes bacterium]|nr:PorV/PorQ family protein [Gemmatimonadota bacterium]